MVLTYKNFFPVLLLVKANHQIKPVNHAQAAHVQPAPVQVVSVPIRRTLDFFILIKEMWIFPACFNQNLMEVWKYFPR